jgi:hypothetical protein
MTNKQNLKILKDLFRCEGWQRSAEHSPAAARMDAFRAAQSQGFDAPWETFKRMWQQIQATP